MNNEIWKDIEGYGNKYQVSSEGRVRKKNKDKRCKPYRYLMPNCNNNSGYYKVLLSYEGSRRNVLVHRLVAETFINNPEKKPCVNHKDGCKKNNNVKNLEWVTHEENNIHAVKTGLFDHLIKALSKSVVQCDSKGKNIRTWDSFHQIERETGLSASYICRKCKGNGYAYGYLWRYADEQL